MAFPRTIGQASALLEANIDIDYIIDISVPDSEIIKTLDGSFGTHLSLEGSIILSLIPLKLRVLMMKRESRWS